MGKQAEHDWQTLNREVHGTDEIDRRDLLAEIGAALDFMGDDDIGFIVRAVDRGHYSTLGGLLANAMQSMGRNGGAK